MAVLVGPSNANTDCRPASSLDQATDTRVDINLHYGIPLVADSERYRGKNHRCHSQAGLIQTYSAADVFIMR